MAIVVTEALSLLQQLRDKWAFRRELKEAQQSKHRLVESIIEHLHRDLTNACP